MYDVRQFKPALYLLVFLGMSGLSVAAQSPVIWTICTAALAVNAWLVWSGRFAPLPRWLANLVTVAAFCYLVIQVMQLGQRSALAIGQFLVFLQLVKLFEQRVNRDYAQTIVLSLLLMVAAAVNTASLLFGVLLTAHLLVGLYVSLLFGLKNESDHVRTVTTVVDARLNAGALMRDQRNLSRSLRRLTSLISVAGVAAAVAVFVLFPRSSTAMLPQIDLLSGQTLTGFSERVGFQQVARIQQNDQIVAHVQVHRDGELVAGTMPLLLRGVTLDSYSGAGGDRSGRWQWARTPSPEHEVDAPREQWVSLGSPAGEQWQQQIRLMPTGTSALFALPGISQIRFTRHGGPIVYTAADQAVRRQDRVLSPLEYEVVSRGVLSVPPGTRSSSGEPLTLRQLQRAVPQVTRRPRQTAIDPLIGEYARRPEVSGTDDQGPLAPRRPTGALTHALDQAIATNIEKHLQSQFTYTLDLTDSGLTLDQDPMVTFLYDLRRGHCEYFAGAMTLMCQDLGLTARMVVGFLSDEYNGFTESYVVRQSHAHAWVEVLLPDGTWQTFDPTASRQAGGLGARTERGAIGRIAGQVSHFMDYLQQIWATKVVAYDRGNRDDLMEDVNQRISEAAVESSQSLAGVTDRMEALGLWLATHVIGPVIAAMVLAVIGAIGWYVYGRLRLRRRAARIGLEGLPARRQRTLARQLGFYDELLRLLERSGIARPAHLTPMEFTRTLTFLPLGTFSAIRRLTGIYYRVRYGEAALSPRVHARLDRVVEGVRRELESNGRAPAGA